MDRRGLPGTCVAVLLLSALVAPVAPTGRTAPAGAQAPDRDVSARTTPQAAHAAELIGAEELTGMRVVNTRGEELGKLGDGVLDADHRRIAYLVMSTGALGVGQDYLPVPWAAFRFVDEERVEQMGELDEERAEPRELKPEERRPWHELERVAVRDASPQHLRQAPSFSRGNWPDFSDPTWQQRVEEHYRGQMSDAERRTGEPTTLRRRRAPRTGDLLPEEPERPQDSDDDDEDDEDDDPARAVTTKRRL